MKAISQNQKLIDLFKEPEVSFTLEQRLKIYSSALKMLKKSPEECKHFTGHYSMCIAIRKCAQEYTDILLIKGDNQLISLTSKNFPEFFKANPRVVKHNSAWFPNTDLRLRISHLKKCINITLGTLCVRRKQELVKKRKAYVQEVKRLIKLKEFKKAQEYMSNIPVKIYDSICAYAYNKGEYSSLFKAIESNLYKSPFNHQEEFGLSLSEIHLDQRIYNSLIPDIL